MQKTTWSAILCPVAANNLPDGRIEGAAKAPAVAIPAFFIKPLLFIA
jgi:hypothetical protein